MRPFAMPVLASMVVVTLACSDDRGPLEPAATVTAEAPKVGAGKAKFLVLTTTVQLDPSPTVRVVTVTCPEGSIATGGGRHTSAREVIILASYPSTSDGGVPEDGTAANGWTLHVDGADTTGRPALTAFVVCTN